MDNFDSAQKLSQKQGQENLKVQSSFSVPDDIRQLIDGIPDYSIFLLNANGLVQSWNYIALGSFGLKPEEILGKSIYEVLPCDGSHLELDLQQAKKSGKFQRETWCFRKNGSKFWANVHIIPFHEEANDSIKGYGLIIRDLSERKKAEERYRIMVDSIRDYGIFMLDKEGFIQSWNLGAQKLKGYTPEEIIGKHFSIFYTQPDIDRNHPATELKLAIESGRYEEEGWRIRKDGTQFWANIVITPLYESGELTGFAKVTRDLTERKLAEESLKKAYDELESFSYTISHDLRAPLRSMHGFSAILEETLKDKLDPRSKDYLHRVREASQKMSRLIDDLLNLSHLGRTAINIEPSVNLSKLARQINEDLASQNPDRNVKVDIQPNLVAAADLSLIRVVLENLFNNAWKYTAKVNPAHIQFGCDSKNSELVYYVRDNGAGFNMQYSSKLFGPFQRLHSNNEFPGNGIGLAGVKRIIERHGGWITGEGAPDKGAIFRFTLKKSSHGEKYET